MIFKRLSLKQKYIIMGILMICGISLLIYVSNDNKRKNEEIKASYEKIINSKKEDNAKQAQVLLNKEEEKKREEEKVNQIYNTALLDYSNKNYNKSIKGCDEILVLDENNYKALSLKGINLCFTQNYNKGIVLIDKAIQIKGDFGFGIFNKALSLDIVGKYEEAKKYYLKALEVEKYPFTYYNLSIIFEREGNTSESLKYLKDSINLKISLKNNAKEEIVFSKLKDNKEFKEIVN